MSVSIIIQTATKRYLFFRMQESHITSAVCRCDSGAVTRVQFYKKNRQHTHRVEMEEKRINKFDVKTSLTTTAMRCASRAFQSTIFTAPKHISSRGSQTFFIAFYCCCNHSFLNTSFHSIGINSTLCLSISLVEN